MAQTVFSNDMVAHVWAQLRQPSGRSNNGNFYFEGASLYSYGSHFLAGYILDGVALLNADSYSISTAKHMSYASRAVSHRDHFYIASLTDWRDALGFMAWRTRNKDSANPEYVKRWKGNVRKLLLEHAANLARRRNAYRYETDSRHDEREEAGEFLTRMAGLPAAAWGAIKKERARLDAAKAKADARAKAKAAHESAVRYATMSDSEFRALMRKDHSRYECYYDREAKAIYHAIRYAKAHGFSDKRRAVLKDRRAIALARKAGYHGAERRFRHWQGVRQDIAMVRSCARILGGVAIDGAGPFGISARTEATRKGAAALASLSNVAAFPSASRFRMRAESARLAGELPALQERLDAFREAERQREQAEYEERMRLNRLDRESKIAAWYQGKDVRITFDANSGGAALRINGDMLETSHGASVPLAHAVKAFRFVKLMRQRGTEWKRNGKTIRVGHFQIDSIAANGDFVAGCHRFTWPEIERAAGLAGVADIEASDAAVIASNAA